MKIWGAIMINKNICELVNYAVKSKVITERDRIFAVNRLLEVLGLDEFVECDKVEERPLEDILKDMIDYAAEKGMLDGSSVVERDLFDTKLMGAITPFPSAVVDKFESLYAKSPVDATNWYYDFSCNTEGLLLFNFHNVLLCRKNKH